MKSICPVSAAVAAALLLACPATADPPTMPVVDHAGYTTTTDADWVFFRAYRGGGQGCGISPDGTVGCDIAVDRNADGTVVQWGESGPPGSYSCGSRNCPLPPPGTNEIVAGPQSAARYAMSDSPTFTRNVAVLPQDHLIVNGNASCYVSSASPGGISCRTGNNGFLWAPWGGILEPAG